MKNYRKNAYYLLCLLSSLLVFLAVALGNHEFDWGIENMVDSDATLPDYERGGVSVTNSVPVLCANMYQNGSRAGITKDYVIVEKPRQVRKAMRYA